VVVLQLKRFFQLGDEAHFTASMKVMETFARDVIRRRKAEDAAQRDSRGDLLSRCVPHTCLLVVC